MTDVMPNEVLVLKQPDWGSLPEPEVPYYALTKEGFFLRKRTLFGDATVPIKVSPESLVKAPSGGQFVQNELKYPMWLVLQAHDFFKKVFERHHSEAAVIVVYNMREKKFKLFIPEQYVSYGGVHQKYNPEHLKDGWYAVGTIHSHCDFGAFHSGTDTHDADDMDGLHMTIGRITKEDGPQVATMIAMNKTLFHIKFEEGCDIEARGTTYEETAPEWWMRFVHPNQTAPWLKNQHQHKPAQTGVNPNRGFHVPPSDNKGPITTKNAAGDTITIPRVLPAGYQDWGHWWRENGAAPPAKKPTPSSQVSLWREDDWEGWWEEAMKAAGEDFEPPIPDETEDEAMGPFEKNAEVIEKADALLRAASHLLDASGFRLTYGIVYGGMKGNRSDA